ncbi:MAG: hypothetical protein GY731_03060, partial [Gammaproteobacteria bacterium]|nr:hypothetical protein [Gammaproteobacteria bacterium]
MSKLQLSRTPPLQAPLRFFLTAPWFMAAAGLLAVGSGDVFVSRWTPTALAFTHLVTLGFLAMVMTGALFQIFPVVVGGTVPWASGATNTLHAALSLGAAALSIGFVTGSSELIQAGIIFLIVAIGVFLTVAAVALSSARINLDTARALALAVAALAVTTVMGCILGLGHALPTLVPIQREWTDLHVVWGGLGWIGMLVVGVSYQVVPMFQMTPPYPQWVRQWLTGVVFGALAVWTVAFVVARTTVWLPAIWLEWLAGGVLVCVYGGYALLTLYLQRRRKKRDFNITLWFWQLGMVSAVIGLGG